MTTATTSTRGDKVREAGQKIEDSIRELVEQMSRGKSDQLVRYLEFASRFHTYSFGNLLLILFQRPDAARVAGLRQWNRLGRHVRPGEKGIMILAPMEVWKKPNASSDTLAENEPSESVENESRERIRIFKPVYVFDVSQTDGADLPHLTHATGNAGSALPALKQAVRDSGIVFEEKDYTPGASSAHGASYGGRIVIRNDLDSAEAFRTLAHEFAHELLHWPKDGTPKEPDKKIRETEADATAFVVCRHFGVESDTSDYLLLYDSEPKLLLDRLETVRHTAARIIDAIHSAEEQPGNARKEE
jgi:antirestriction protein ArdC